MSSAAPDRSVALVGGHVYAGAGVTRPGGVAVRAGLIVAVGSDDEVLAASGSAAEVIQLAGGLVSPSFGDAHLHPVNAGVELGQCDLHDARSAAECFDRVAAYAAEHPDDEWILGAGWSVEHFPGGMPSRVDLDRIVPDRPVLLHNRDHHGAWVNSRALAAAAITRATPDPADGRIERDASGEPTGTLQEGAVRLVRAVAPTPSRRALQEGLLRAQSRCFELGITNWQDALLRQHSPGIDGLTPYLDALDAGTLVAKVNGAIWWDRNRGPEQLEEILAAADRVGAGRTRFRATAVKIMVDGIVENFTASLSKPYRDASGRETDNFGISFLERDDLIEAVELIDRHGLQVHFHALGDRAVATALDAVENARRANPAGAARHQLDHLQMVQPEDVRRFRVVRAVANIQPLWACIDDQMTAMTIPFIDPSLVDRHYPFADLEAAGATLAAGSDWPVSSLNPFDGMHVAVNRTPVGVGAEPFLPHQRLRLATVWDAYTAGVAYVNGRDDEFGNLAPGMAADLVVVDRNPFELADSEIASARVVSTWVDGRPVYEHD
jgi:predicted amidohydrolase YtcJ